MSARVAIALCCHHKPWLIMSTLLTLALQDFQDYDVFILFQDGDGQCLKKTSYAPYFRLAEKYGVNVQLSPADERVLNILRQMKGKTVTEIHFENDHALDSGAWYKFIRTGKWRAYDYTFMIQEGTLLTRANVLSAALAFLKEKGIHFLSSGHEKRRISRGLFFNYNTRNPDPTELDFYHNEKIKEVYDVFCRDPEFKKLFSSWSQDCCSVTQDHVPDVFDPVLKKMYQSLRSWRRFKEFPMFGNVIYENTYRRPLKKVVPEYVEKDKIIFHKDNALEWFGCSCQHLVSRAFLEKFSAKLDEHHLYDVLDIPFSGTSLEPIWGFLPAWLRYDKWFFDGMHRVRKNFVNYKREDDPAGMCRYLNCYFRNQIEVRPAGDYIKIHRVGKDVVLNRNMLGPDFWPDKKQPPAVAGEMSDRLASNLR
ncbi:MAG TPA: hypothetical protein PLT76_06110 [Candidatus Omnitrophota bacterium]|nr:hypothetical protein [Candidatus Omnitrophota bacterium]HPB67323.1 hypothetical protein [Candidatus Omnitrophota bacterium]HQO58279.1 hypothetical protein [Candidatus Omnitrophota bacterium]